MSGVMIVGFADREHLCDIQLLHKGRELANSLSEPLLLVSVGSKIREYKHNISDSTYNICDYSLKHYNPSLYSEAVISLVEKEEPSVLLIAATEYGRDLAAVIAAKLRVGLTADCTELCICSKTKYLLQTRPAYGGNVMATIVGKGKFPQMATVRPDVFKIEDIPSSCEKIVLFPFISKEDNKTKVLERKEVLGEVLSLNDAQIVVSGGAGLQNEEGVSLLREFASLLGAELSASRLAVMNNLLPRDIQVGQTGQTIRPKIYIACGISGAVQHMAGVSNSDKIIAINNDPSAPIFRYADVALQGDVFEILPILIDELKKKGL